MGPFSMYGWSRQKIGHFNSMVQWESEYASWCSTTITRGNMCLLKRLIKQLDIFSFIRTGVWLVFLPLRLLVYQIFAQTVQTNQGIIAFLQWRTVNRLEIWCIKTSAWQYSYFQKVNGSIAHAHVSATLPQNVSSKIAMFCKLLLETKSIFWQFLWLQINM